MLKEILIMQKINVRNPNELEKFKKEISGFTCYGFPYKLDDWQIRAVITPFTVL